MSISRVRLMMVILGMVLAALCPVAIGQSEPLTLEAEISRSRAYIGDVITYQVLVRGSSDGAPPSIQFPDGVIVEYRGASSQKFTTMRSINGRQRSQTDSYYKHQYLLTIVKDGVIDIPPAILVQDGTRFESNRATVTALLPEFSSTDWVEVDLPDRPVYSGETVTARVTWWVADQSQSLSFESSEFPESFRISPATPSGNAGQEYELTLYGQRFMSHIDKAVYKGQQMTRLQFDLQITPTEVGGFEFGPVRVIFTRQDSFSRSTRMYAESGPQRMRVVDVPATTRPDGYEGMIGIFAAQTDASNTIVNVGDPIEFRLLVSGPEPMIGLEETIDAQSLSNQGFRVSPDGWKEIPRQRGGERLFSTTIRATDDSIDMIPAIELPSFNPETGAFEVFASKPIPIVVSSVRNVTLSDAVTSGNLGGTIRNDTDSAGFDRSELIENPSVLWASPDAQSIRSSARAFSLRAVLGDPVWIASLAGIGGLPVLCSLVHGVRRSRDPRQAKINRAWKKAQSLHKRGDDVGAIRVYGGAILGIEPDSLTGADLKSIQLSEDIVKRSAAVLSESEGMHYGKLPQTNTDDSLLRAMRRDIRRHGSSSRDLTSRPTTPGRTKR